MTKLVIVESPAKARKIGGFLGDDYVVEASVGHIRDLPQRAADIPKEYKKIAWAKEGVNIEEDFEPLYVINPDKKAKVNELKALMKDADELILATDEDREGEEPNEPLPPRQRANGGDSGRHSLDARHQIPSEAATRGGDERYGKVATRAR